MVEWTDEAREAVREAFLNPDWTTCSHGEPDVAHLCWHCDADRALAALAPHVEAMVREARLAAIRAVDPCRGDDETDDRHFDVCEPFYAAADELLVTSRAEEVRRGE